MEMAALTTTTTTTTKSEEHDESIIEESSSSAIINVCSGGERRRQLQHCTNEESPLNFLHSDDENHVVTTDTLYNNTTAPPLRKHTSSIDNNNMMLDALYLREEDADILEQGVEEKRIQDLVDFDADGRRLDTSSSSSHHHHRLSSSSSLTEVVEGCLSLEDMFDDRQYVHQDTTANTASDGNDILPDNSSGASPSIMPVIAEDSSIIIPHYHHHHSSSPQDDDPNTAKNNNKAYTTTTEQGDNTTTTTDEDYFLGIPSPETQPKPKVTTTTNNNDEIVDMEALNLRITSGRSHNRSVSFDRRMIESAQFAEAVGEDPTDLLLQKIIEQDSSSDFDDDDIDEGGVDMLGGGGSGGVGGEKEFLLEELQDYTTDKASASIEAVGSSSVDVREDEVAVATASSSASSAPSSSAAAAAEDTTNNNNRIEPKCVSTDLSQVSPKETEEVVVCNNNNNNRLVTIERKQSFDRMKDNNNNDDNQQQLLQLQLPTNSAPPTPIPSPAKVRMISPFTSFHPPYVDWKFQRQHSSSASLDGGGGGGNNNRFHSTTTTPTVAAAQTNTTTNNDVADFRGIRLPEITKRGVSRGNYAQLHRKAWLEVSDKHHRYGKNLRMYYKHWESLGHPYHMFFDWLDAKGEATGTELPNLPELPRSVLDSDTVQYIADPGISASYALDIVPDPTDGSAVVIDRRSQTPICTGKEGWIFVLRDHVFYGSQKVIAPNNKVVAPDENNNSTTTITKPHQRFHHSSFFGGKAVASAGIFLTDDQGHLTHLYPHSGHYRPGEAHVQRVLFFMQQLGVELSTFVVDMQQLFKVSRKFAPKGGMGGNDTTTNAAVVVVDNKDKQPTTMPQQQQQQIMKKAKKTDCLHLMCGLETACFLAHKALMIERGVFHQIHKIRRIAPDQRSVRNILNHVN